MAKQPTKYIFVTGGVLSGLGKGITAASLANLLKARGLRVNLQKCDPYLNVDAGLLNPREHGECFVTKDGAETDLDLGHYERFIDEELTQDSSLMSGRVLSEVINDERNGRYEGHTVQIIPQVTGKIQDYIESAADGFDVHLVEIGGTVGDYESLSFIEAIREFSMRVGRENCCYVHLVYLPYLGASKETKTKPAQNSVREIRGLGIQPDVLLARSENQPEESVKAKLSLFCGVDESAIALLPNASSIYDVPLTLEDEGIADVIVKKLSLQPQKADLVQWRDMVNRATTTYKTTLNVGIVAKYMDNEDTYMCVFEALKAAAWWNDVSINISWIDAQKFAKLENPQLDEYDGIVVPGGFGTRGVDGKIAAAQTAFSTKLPYLGLCYGLHMAVIATARLAGNTTAHTTEVDRKTAMPVISTMDGQDGKENTGGTMRLGDYDCDLSEDSKVRALYGQASIVERHRHRFECNPKFVDQYESWGIKAVGVNPQTNLVEIIEGIDHPFFVASQFHPEFKGRPVRAHPLFDGFIKAAKQRKSR